MIFSATCWTMPARSAIATSSTAVASVIFSWRAWLMSTGSNFTRGWSLTASMRALTSSRRFCAATTASCCETLTSFPPPARFETFFFASASALLMAIRSWRRSACSLRAATAIGELERFSSLSSSRCPEAAPSVAARSASSSFSMSGSGPRAPYIRTSSRMRIAWSASLAPETPRTVRRWPTDSSGTILIPSFASASYQSLSVGSAR